MVQIKSRVFAGDISKRRVVMPWRRTVEMCWRNLKNRRGRSLLVLVSIAVVAAFLVSTLGYNSIVSQLRTSTDVHTRAMLERAGLLANQPDSEKRQHDRTIWLLGLSGLLCLVGVTNTMYMSVTERYREIGTLKCLGALNSFVVRLFMVESAFIGLVSSAVGAIVGALLTLLQVGVMLEFECLLYGGVVKALVVTVPTAIGGGTVLALVAAAYPAMVAARMEAVEAMRVEV